MAETEKERFISFRVTEDEYKEIENIALISGNKPNEWCRKLVLWEAANGTPLVGSDRLIYEEIARVRFLLGSGFDLLAAGKLNQGEWLQLLGRADKNPAALADTLLKLRERERSSG